MASHKKIIRIITGEILFWLHTVFILAALVSGLFFSIWLVVGLVILIKVQQIIFHGCLITRLEVNTGGIKRGQTYYQLAVQRFSNRHLSRKQVNRLSIFMSASTILIAVVAGILNFRIPL